MNNNDLVDISKIKSDDFFNLIESMTSEIEVEILKAQGINNVLSLLRAQDLYSIFKLDCTELEDLRNRACLQLKGGDYMIRPAIKNNLDYCINVLKTTLPEQLSYRSESHNQHSDDSYKQPDCFLNTFINNINENTDRSKFRYQYNSNMRRFATAVYALGGRNVYQFLRLNLPGAFPSIPTLESYYNEFCTRIEEGEFRFEQLINYSNKLNCSHLYASEDCTGVVSKVHYDVESNSFIGFCPEQKNGIPSLRQYQTDDFLELEEWFNTIKQSTLVNIHTVQPITREGSAPFILSTFGTDNQTTSISILFRWIYIYEKCYTNNIRIIGYSSDADPKYLKAMRLATGYFSQIPNIDLLNRHDVFQIHIPNSWSWYYMRSNQLFLCFQDGIHLATKLRNRLLSKTASLHMGTYDISVNDLQNLIDNHSKLDHNLVLSDIYVKDRQNYASCLKISSTNVLNMLDQHKSTFGTHSYLKILQFVTIAYIDKTTYILKRLFYAWSSVFICRFWLTWLKYESMINTKTTNRQARMPPSRELEQHFITFAAFNSIELNAHTLTFILLLVLNKKLPVESLNIYLFSSQPCENTFRSARALTGPFSTMTNFTIQQFLSKTRKISILNEIKCFEESNTDSNKIKFPTHHKQNQNNSSSSIPTNLDEITIDNIEKTIYDAYEYAKSVIEKLEMSALLIKYKVFELNDLCMNVRDDLHKRIYINDNSILNDDDLEYDSDADEDIINSTTASDVNSERENEDSDTEAETKSTKDAYNGMRIYSSIDDKDKHKFFKIEINGKKKYMHKQTAIWYLTNKNNRLSSDRTVRVQQMNRQ